MVTRMRRARRTFPSACLVLFLLPGLTASGALAQTASALLKEGEVLGTSGTVNSINNPSVNHIGGFSVQVNTLNGTTTLSHIWGNAAGGAGAFLVSEGTFGNYLLTAFESFNGLNDRGEACFGVTATDVTTNETGLDGVFVDATPILVELQPVASIPGQWSVFNSRPGCTGSDVYWVGGISSTRGGATQNRVLFLGNGATPVLRGGDIISGVALPHVTGGMDFDVRFSRLSTHHVIDAQVTGSTANDRVLAVDRAAVVAGGGLVREGLPVPAAVGGLPLENWANFDFMGVTESGRVFATGDTSAATTVDEFVFDNGQIVLREGTVFAGPGGNYTISGDIEGGYQNRQGDWAVTWDANPPAGANREILILNGVMVLQENDLVDLTGDGVPDANGILRDFTGISSLVVGPRDASGNVTVYFTADIDVNNTPTTSGDDLEALFKLTVPSGGANQPPLAICENVTVPAGTGCAAEAEVDAGSSDANDDPLAIAQSPAGPYPIGTTLVTLTVTDVQGATDSCTATVTVTFDACDDNDACTADSCDPVSGCVNTPISCDDGNPCTDDSCDPTSGCVTTNNTAPCDDNNACTAGDTCGDGACQEGPPVNCDDANACTVDACDPGSGCTYEIDLCDDSNACTADSCDPTTGCAHETITCDDFDQCTSDACDPGSGCFTTPITCDDSSQCTIDSCDPNQGCRFEPVDCSDGNACTSDGCHPSSGCFTQPVDCNDSNACTVESCEPVSGCQYEAVVCDDGDGCTVDGCDPATGCTFGDPGVGEPNPRTNGYWKRLCQGPHSGDELSEADAACVASQGATFAGVSSVADICAVLQQGGEGGTCGHTEIDLMALALNVCHQRLCGGNAISSQYSDNTTVGESYDEADGILADPDSSHASCLQAKGLLEEVNTGRALGLDTVTLTRAAGGGARLVWQPPYAIDPIKYNVWRRPAGSLAAFAKIGETTTPVFDDASPGSFEYDVTPVR